MMTILPRALQNLAPSKDMKHVHWPLNGTKLSLSGTNMTLNGTKLSLSGP